MPHFKTSIFIQRPPDVVVQAFLNPDNLVHYTTDLERFEVVSGTSAEVGSVARLHYSQKGRRYILEDRLVAVDPGKKYVSQVSGDALVARVETTFAPSRDGTDMVVSWTGSANKTVLKLLFPFLRGKMVKEAAAELWRFKNLVEVKGVNFS